MALMRALPLDQDPELVLRVVRKTLRSTGVSVEELVAGARKREISLADAIEDDRTTIAKLEREIEARKTHIDEVLGELEETEAVRKRLQEAIESESQVGALMPLEEMMRLQAEHAAQASQAPPNIQTSQPSQTPPKPSAAPAPKAVTFPPPLKKSVAPLKPPLLPSRPAKPPETSSTTPPNVAVPVAAKPPATRATSALLESETVDDLTGGEGPPSEPTLRVEVPVKNEKGTAEDVTAKTPSK
jgi:hypothetical protein